MAAVAEPMQAKRLQCRQEAATLVTDDIAKPGRKAKAHIEPDKIRYCRTRPRSPEFHARHADIFYAHRAFKGG